MYFDPGFGGALLQIVVTIAAAGGILLFSLRRKLRALFSKGKERSARNASIGVDADAVEANKLDDGGVIDVLSDDEADGNKTGAE